MKHHNVFRALVQPGLDGLANVTQTLQWRRQCVRPTKVEHLQVANTKHIVITLRYVTLTVRYGKKRECKCFDWQAERYPDVTGFLLFSAYELRCIRLYFGQRLRAGDGRCLKSWRRLSLHIYICAYIYNSNFKYVEYWLNLSLWQLPKFFTNPLRMCNLFF